MRERDAAALVSNEPDFSAGHTTNVTGGMKPGKRSLKKASIKVFAIVIAVIVLIMLFITPIYAIDAISTRLIEETDVQYADAVQSKALVFQNALENGEVPKNTFDRLKQEGIEVGYLDGETFIASRFGETKVAAADLDSAITYGSGSGNSPLSLRLEDGTVIPASDFYRAVNTNVKLYDAFTNATYSRAAYYYDEEAQRVFREIGTSRNNYSSDESLEDIMDGLMGSGNKVGVTDRTWHYMPIWEINSSTGETWYSEWEQVPDEFNCSGTGVSPIAIWKIPIVDSETDPETGITTYGIAGYDYQYGDYGCDGSNASTYMRTVAQANMSAGNDTQTLKNTTDSLKAADTMSKEQQSMLLYAGFAESFSRTKAGYGSTNSDTNSILAAIASLGSVNSGANVNDVMNRLYETATVTILDQNGNPVQITGSMLESPSLYSILTGEKLDTSSLDGYYSSDRIINIMKNNGIDVEKDTTRKTVASKQKNTSSTLGRWTTDSRDYAPSNQQVVKVQGQNYNYGNYNSTSVNVVEPIINSSLYKNSFNDIVGVSAGEMLVEGAVNVGKELAKASGAAAGDKDAVMAYVNLTSDVLAMDAAADRLNRSPLDITSKNTFLGSIVYKFAISSMKSGSFLNKVASVSHVTANAIRNILPSASAADNENELYLSNIGNCETLGNIDAVGTEATCSMIATFDTSTYGGTNGQIYSNSDFQNFLNNNVEPDGTIKEDSNLAMYINYNELRHTSMGLTDGEIVENYQKQENGVLRIVIKALTAIRNLFGAAEKADNGEIPDEATGATFVDSSKNSDWEKTYKYAQRYISLARAAETMRQYDGDETAYNFYGFGLGNPIARYIEEHSDDRIASND